MNTAIEKTGFLTAYKREIKALKSGKTPEAVAEALEEKAKETYGDVRSHNVSAFMPPNKPVNVRCIHCGKTYGSDEITLEYRPHMQDALVRMREPLSPLWWCKETRCDGAGFGYDIMEVKV